VSEGDREGDTSALEKQCQRKEKEILHHHLLHLLLPEMEARAKKHQKYLCPSKC